MKFLPLVSVGTLYLAYESANFKPISLRTTGAIWPWIQEQDSGFGVWSPQRVTYCHEQHLGVSGAANKPPVKLCRWVRLSSCYWRQARLYPHFRRLGRGLQKNDVRRRGRAPSWADSGGGVLDVISNFAPEMFSAGVSMMENRQTKVYWPPHVDETHQK